MQWTRIKEHLIPTIMQEIDIVTTKYTNLINQLKQQKTPETLSSFFTLKADISKRIEELENYFDDNFGNPRMLCLEKGIVNLKKLLFYNPDINNELEEPDLETFRGLTVDMSKIGTRNSTINDITKTSSPAKPKAKVNKPTKFATAKKNNIDRTNKRGVKTSAEKTYSNGDTTDRNIVTSPQKENNDTIVKKKIHIRLTEDEYKLYQKLRTKRMLTVK